jgi:hypothetical protein
LLDAGPADRAEATIAEIAAAVEERPGRLREIAGVAHGAAGAALLHAYLARATGDGRSEERALAWLGRALDGVGDSASDVSLFVGVAGIGWTGQHLAALLDVEEPDPDGYLDEVLEDMLRSSPWPGAFDLVYGLAGLGVYALERLPRPAARACLELVVARLGELSERRPEGTAWFTSPRHLPPDARAEAPDGFFDLGVAHGVPGVVALLAAAEASGVAGDSARPLAEGAVSWLLAQRLPDGGQSAFPSRLLPGRDPAPARMAWCYGDAGVAAALLLAARAFGIDEWEQEALRLARRASARRGEDTRVGDPWLCHGAAGLGHLFNRMHQATDDAEFADAARFWLERALDLRPPGGDDSGFLTGACGVALALLAAIGDVEPGWDRLLAVSARGGLP